MKKTTLPGEFVVNIVCAEGVVCGGIVQEKTVDARRGQHYTVRGVLVRGGFKSYRSFRAYELLDDVAERIVTDFAVEHYVGI